MPKKIRKNLSDNGIPYDKKKFQGHITITKKAKFETKFEDLLNELPNVETTVAEFSLMRSDRGKNGMIYTPIYSIEAEPL